MRVRRRWVLPTLHCAARGELVDVAARLMAAVRDAELGLVVQRARALSGWGASSGAALCWGMDAALRRRGLERAQAVKPETGRRPDAGS